MRELDVQCARALGYTTLYADDSVFGPSLYLHDAGAIRDPHGTSNAHLFGARWERLRVNDVVGEYCVRLCPAFSESHEAARILEDEIERRGRQTGYVMALMRMLDTRQMCGMDEKWALIRATPEQRARAFLEAVTDA